MTSKGFPISAEIADHKTDGLSPEDGSKIWKIVPRRKPGSVNASQTIGEIMQKLNRADGDVYRVIITEDSSD